MRKENRLLIIFFIVFAFPASSLFAQYENIWVFGQQAGLDFNNGSPVPIQTSIDGFGEANASVSDHNGSLLFYTEGSYIWDKNGNLMPNGSDLTPFNSTLPVTSSSCQGTVIVPYPDHENWYFVFAITDIEMGGNLGRLYYSIVDMSLNGGLGDVVPGAKGIFVDSMLTESVMATVGNHCNIWLITRSALFQEFRIYEISASGLNVTPVLSPFGGNGVGGSMVVSGDRKKLAVTTGGSYGLWLYDFDAGSGIVSNPITLQPFSYGVGVAFSPDNTKLYVNPDGALFQYDITSGNDMVINNSESLIGTTSGYTHLMLAPNGKIYFHSSTLNALGVIDNPNLPGVLCDFAPEVVHLLGGTSASAGLPNIVPVIPHDTFLTHQPVSAPCFAAGIAVGANNDTTGWDYTWNTGSTEMAISADTPGTYWVSYHTPPCNYHTDTFMVSFPNGVLPDLHIDTSCVNAANGRAYASTYMGDTVNYAYTWINEAGDTLSTGDTLTQVPSGNYAVHIRTVHCDTVLPFFLPEADFQVSFLSDSIVCMGGAVTFQNTSSSHFTGFTWSFGDGDSSFVAQPPAHPYLHPGRYEVMLAGSGAICSDTSRKIIIVDSMLAGAFLAAPDSICTGRSIAFLPQTDSTTISLHWQWGDGTEMSGPDEHSVYHAYDSAGLMPVRLHARFRACPDASFTDTVYVYSLPKVYLGPDSGLCLDGNPILLQNLQPAPVKTHHYLWNTGDTTATLKVVHPGIYSLTISTEPLGCSTTESVEIKKDCYIDVPNAFTPDGDGINDYFFPRQVLSKKVTRFRMQILNRWGQQVFETTNTHGRGWDGRFNGKEQPMGVYIYLIDAEIDGHLTEHYQGNTTLVR